MCTYLSGHVKHVLFLFITSLLLYSPLAVRASVLEKVSLQLSWKYQFEFAGFIMAKEKGFYKKSGLDVELIEYQPGINIVKKILSQTNNYGIHNSSVIINDGKITPIVLMATYFQQSPLVFVTTKAIKTPNDLIGKTIMGTKDELKYSSLAFLLDRFYATAENTNFVEHTYNINDFIQHKVDAMSAFRTNQLFELDQLNIEYNTIDPTDFGFLMSAVNLFTSQNEALEHPNRTQKFIEASNQGWHYALAHPQETIAVIYNKYSKRKSIAALTHEAGVTKKMMLQGLFDIGSINQDLSLHVIKQLQYNGLLTEHQELEAFTFNQFLHKNDHIVTFNDEQKLYLKNKQVIKMCIDPDWMPLESIHNGKHIGIAADIIATFASLLPIPIQLVKTKSWHESMEKAEQRQCDILSLVASTPNRTTYMDFTTPYLTVPIVMATTNDKGFISDITRILDKKFGIVKSYAKVENLRRTIPGINIHEVDSINAGLKQVENGHLYGYIDNLMSIGSSIQKDFNGTLKISSRLDDDLHLSIATRNDEPMLQEIFNTLVRSITLEDKQAVYNQWVSVKHDTAFNYTLMWQLTGGLSLLSIGFIYHYYQLRKLNQYLTTLSITDKLTGLYNRVKIDEVLADKKAENNRYHTDVAIVLLDIDYFKKVNDTYGHIVGDAVLVEFAGIIQNNSRDVDYVGRWGGEEFIIICPHTSTTEAANLAEKLLNLVRNYSFLKIGKLTASAGVSSMFASLSINKTLIQADKALYISKQTGRDKVSVIAEETHAQFANSTPS
jgi:polar amino acid transport system substrate-binding protein